MEYRTDPTRIRGSVAPVVTPFHADGSPDPEGLRRLIEFQLAAGSHGISLGGSAGEPGTQTLAERAAAIRLAADTIADRVPFVPGTGSARLDETVELTGIARDAGADAALVITPYYARPTQDTLYAWYRTVAREYPDLPIVIYNVPGRTAVDVAPQTVARLFRDLDNVVGIADATRNLEHVSRVLHACGPRLLVWSGVELLGLPLLTLGAAGFLNAVATVAPAAVARLYAAAVAGDLDQARELHYGLHPLVDLLSIESTAAAAKWVLAERGLLGSAFVRPPLMPLTADGQRRAGELLARTADLLPPAVTDRPG